MEISDVKTYLGKRVKYWSNIIIPSISLVEVGFEKCGDYKAIVFVFDTNGKKSVGVNFDDDFVRANRFNIKNKYIDDIIIHELSHVDDIISNSNGDKVKNAHGRRSFRQRVKKHSGSVVPSVPSLLHDFKNYYLYFGGRDYGYVPSDILTASLKQCENCGHMIITPASRKSVCKRCDSTMVVKRRLKPRDALNYMLIMEKCNNDPLHDKVQEFVSRYHLD